MTSARHKRSHPDRIGRYRLLEELGRGSYGVVYLAERDGDGLKFAIKVLTDRAVENEEAMARFKLEARVASKIDDPGVVAIHETGRVGPRPYYVMEYCPGPTLYERRKREGKLPPLEAAQIVARLARIIGSAHAMGVIHRDLKPANVILSEPDGDPRITDFGLAQDRAHHQRLTKTGDVVGTPYYMAAEQIRGEPDIDARVDVYALGVILYELLADERPYQAPTLVEVSQLVTSGAAAPLIQKVPDVPGPLVAIQRRAMAVDRNERYMNATALAEDLEAFVRGSVEVSENLDGPRKTPLLIGAAVAVVLLAVSLAIAIPWARRQAASEQARALLAEAKTTSGDARDLLARAAKLSEHDPQLVAEIQVEQQQREEASWIRRLRGRVEAGGSAAEVKALLNGAPAFEALREARDALATAALKEQRYAVAAALAVGNPTLEATVSVAQGEGEARRRLSEARALIARGQSSEARPLLRAARDRLSAGPLLEEVTGELKGLDAAMLLTSIPRLLRRPDPWTPIEERLREAEKAARPSSPLAHQVALWRVRIHRYRGRYEQVIEAAAPLLGLANPIGYEARWQRNMALYRLMRHGEGLPDFQRLAQEDRSGVWGLTAKSLVQFSNEGRPAEAVKTGRLAVRADSSSVEAQLTLSFALMNSGNQDESQAILDRVLRAFPAHPRAHLGQAFLSHRRQQYNEALESYTRVIALTGPLGMPLARQQRGATYRLLRRLDPALADLNAALERAPGMIQARLVRASILHTQGKKTEAEADVRAAAKQDFPTFERLFATQLGPHLIRRVRKTLVDDPLVTASVPTPPPLRYATGALGKAQRAARAGKPHAAVLSALATAESAATDDAARQAVQLERADYLWRRGRYEKAVAAAQKIAKVPGRIGYQARYVIGFSRLWQLRYKEGLAELKRLKDEDPEGPVGNNAGAAWLSYSRRNPEGEVLARKAIELDPTWVDSYVSLMFCLNDQSKRLTALAVAKRLLPNAPDHPRAHMAVAMNLVNLRQNKEARAAIDRVVALTEPQSALRALAFQSRHAYNTRDWKTAITAADRYLKRSPTDTSALRFMRGMAHLRTNAPQRALIDLREFGRRNRNGFQQMFQRLGPQDQQAIRQLLRQPRSR